MGRLFRQMTFFHWKARDLPKTQPFNLKKIRKYLLSLKMASTILSIAMVVAPVIGYIDQVKEKKTNREP